ncbi:MAG: YicC family protein [Saccharofermentans sp.]|nr:YicC family protein [Saccharofermentans sp.]
MASSMTGFGRGEKIFDTRRYTVELKSVNSRFCDINIRMPRLFNFADSKIRKLITDRLVRGKIDVFINFDDAESAATEVVVNEGLARAYAGALSRISEITEAENELTASRLASFQDVLTVRQKSVDEDALYEELVSCMNAAIDGMCEMRAIEGQNLVDDILGKVSQLENLRDEIATRAPGVVEDYRVRLSNRIDEILDSEKRALYDESRLAAEVTVFADKCAIDEELKRLISHYGQARKILGGEANVGKKMDFLIQEINRETNTIGSKANDIEITNRVLLMKNLIEEMREQIQNLV